MTENITLTLEQAKLCNMRVWEYLVEVCMLLRSPLISRLQAELQEYLVQTNANSLMLDGCLERSLQLDPSKHTEVKDALVSEVKVNARLKQYVQMCQVQMRELQACGRLVPHCCTSWIYQDFPVPSHLIEVETQPLTVLCEHVLDRYDLDKDVQFKKILLYLEVASLWHNNSSFSSKAQQKPASVCSRTSHGNIPEAAGNTATDGTQPDAEEQTAIINDTEKQPVKVFTNEYTKVGCSRVESELVLRLVRTSRGVGVDTSSETAIARILHESVESQCQLQGAGYLVYRHKKHVRRARKAAAQTRPQDDQMSSLCTLSPDQIAENSPVQSILDTDIIEVVSIEESSKAYLDNIAKFQQKFKEASQVGQGNGRGRKRKAADSSVCKEIQTKYSKTRMETTLTALKHRVTKRHMERGCH